MLILADAFLGEALFRKKPGQNKNHQKKMKIVCMVLIIYYIFAEILIKITNKTK